MLLDVLLFLLHSVAESTLLSTWTWLELTQGYTGLQYSYIVAVQPFQIHELLRWCYQHVCMESPCSVEARSRMRAESKFY